MIIGGTLLTGGRGTLIGSILGVLVFTTITNLFILNNLATEVQNIAKGADHRRRRAVPEPRPARGHLTLAHRSTPPHEGGRRCPIRSTPSAPLGRRGVPAPARSPLGAGAALAACTSNTPPPAAAARPDRRRRRAAATPRRAGPVTIGFSAPAADHGWIAAIANERQGPGGEVPGRRRSSR